MAKSLRNTESVVKLVILVFLLFLMWTARVYPEKSRLFPELLGGVTVIFIIVSFVQDFMKPKGEKKKEEVKEAGSPPSDIVEEKLRWVKEMEEKGEMDEDAAYALLEEGIRKKRLYQSSLIILISVGIGYLGGFLLTVPFYFFAFGMLQGEKKHTLRYIIIALGVTVVTYLLFTTLMEIPLLRGVLWKIG